MFSRISNFLILMLFCSGSFAQIALGPENVLSGLNGPNDVKSLDLDGDGDNDIICVFTQSGSIVWYENVGGMAFIQHDPLTTEADGVSDFLPADIDMDGDTDVLFTHMSSGGLMWIRNLGSGQFEEPANLLADILQINEVFALQAVGDSQLDLLIHAGTDLFLYE